ncbi:MAG: hypothetical protein HN919_13720 [Verrucomicrobia bacterium]|jgi:hypothetical protein|nr:hypothetical protein [Verrucomicrobiota bacterium]
MMTAKKITNVLTVAVAAMALVAITTSRVEAAWTPADITTALWLDANDGSTIHTDDAVGFVSQWDDKSGNDKHAIQVTGSNQPETDLRTIGGLNVIAFNGSSQYLTVNGSISAQPCTVFFVAKTTIGPGRDYLFDGANSARSMVALNYEGTVQMYAGGWGDSGISTPTDPCIVAAAFNTTSSDEIAVDGVNVTGLSVGGGTLTDGMNLGVATDEAYHWLEGDIAEFIIVSGAPDETARQKMEGYLAWKWGLESNLPIGHPYKTAAPGGGAATPGTLIYGK